MNDWTFVLQVAIGLPGMNLMWIERCEAMPPFLPPIGSTIAATKLKHPAYVENIITNFVAKEIIVAAACRVGGHQATDVFNHAIENGWIAE